MCRCPRCVVWFDPGGAFSVVLGALALVAARGLDSVAEARAGLRAGGLAEAGM